MIVIYVIRFTLVLSYNRPRFCPNASWYSSATTFASSNIIGLQPYGIFINTMNTVYAVSRSNNTILIWLEGSNTPTKTISGDLNQSVSLFVSSNADIYVDNGEFNQRVDMWTFNANNSVSVMNVSSGCLGLHIDINDTLYCSICDFHQVVKQYLNDSAATSTIRAGTGISGNGSDMLSSPYGIFVNTDFDLYVADCGNDRIQIFPSGQLTGFTVAGSGAPATITLSCPTGVVLDTDNYLFIVDRDNHRIVASGLNGFRCVAGCTGLNSSSSSQLQYPQSMAFDSYGNIFVTDRDNNRIQKFILQYNFCGKF
jgi:hypothetical protein